MFPVELAYLSQSTSDYVQEAVKVVWGIHLQVLAITQAKAVSSDISPLWTARPGRRISIPDWQRRDRSLLVRAGRSYPYVRLHT